MKLLIVHSHYRPGGVRRVIELAAPHLAKALGSRGVELILVGGEAPDTLWRDRLTASMGGIPVSYAIEPALGYFSEQRPSSGRVGGTAKWLQRCTAHFENVLLGSGPENCVVWAHNQGLGRNLLVTRSLVRACAARGVPLVFHHHDWWFDNRWARWREMRGAGFRTLADVARTIFPVDRNVRHVAINRADASILRRHFGGQSGWLPNLSERARPPSAERVRTACQWLRNRVGDDAPIWIVPCRLLRRKNLAEALLLTRWLRPKAWLLTTGGASSADEREYANALTAAARQHGWRMQLGVLADGETAAPTVPELLAASEVVLLTSLQEGFGLPNLEAAAAGRPLITRRLPNVAPDLVRFGFRFPQAYNDVMIDPTLFDWGGELRRQARRWRDWRGALPRAAARSIGTPEILLSERRPVAFPFSRLTLVAQLEVLAHDAAQSWELCAPLNPALVRWRKRASHGELQVSPWPRTADHWLSGPAYARRFLAVLKRGRGSAAASTPAPSDARSANVFEAFIRAKLGTENHYPLLWTSYP